MRGCVLVSPLAVCLTVALWGAAVCEAFDLGWSPVSSGDGESLPDWKNIKAQPCNLGLQDKYGKPFWHGTRFRPLGCVNRFFRL